MLGTGFYFGNAEAMGKKKGGGEMGLDARVLSKEFGCATWKGQCPGVCMCCLLQPAWSYVFSSVPLEPYMSMAIVWLPLSSL